MNRVEELEEQLALGTITNDNLEILYSWYAEEGYKLWQTKINETDKAKRMVYQAKLDEFENKDLNFLKVYLDFLIYTNEQEQSINNGNGFVLDAKKGIQEDAR